MKQYGLKVCFAVALAFLQAFFCLSVPAAVGGAVNVGVQNKGFADTFPRVMSQDAFELLEGILPGQTFETFRRSYRRLRKAPSSFPEQYADAGQGYYYVGGDDDTIESVYQTAVVAAVYKIRSTKGYEKMDFDALLSRFSVTFLKRRFSKMTLSEAEKEDCYQRAMQADAALKLQVGSVLLPKIYENAGVDCQASQRAYLKVQACRIALLALLQCGCALAASRLFSGVSAAVEKRLHDELFQKYLSFSRKTRATFSSTAIRELHNGDVTRVGNMINYGGSAAVYSLAILLIGGVLTFQKSPLFLLLILLSATVILLFILIVYRVNYKKYQRMDACYLQYSTILKTQLAQMLTVRSANAQDYEKPRVDFLSGSIRKDEGSVMRAIHISINASGLVINILIAAILYLGCRAMMRAGVTLGDIVTLMQYSIVIVTAVIMLGAAAVFAPNAIIAVKKLRAVLMLRQDDAASFGSTVIDGVETVAFDGVRVLPQSKPISFTAHKGELIVVTGAAGAGKSTLMSVLCKTCRPAQGAVYINGSDVDTLSGAYPSRFVSLAPTRPVLFSDTVENNMLLYGACGDENERMQALRTAVCDFLPADTGALQFYLKNAGENLSGGQQSRLSIACALSKPAQIYIFDDCLAAIDEENRQTLIRNLQNAKKNAILFVVTQTPGIVPNADQVICLENERGDA